MTNLTIPIPVLKKIADLGNCSQKDGRSRTSLFPKRCIQSLYRFRNAHHTTFVAPLSYRLRPVKKFPIACKPTNSIISQLSQLSQDSHFSRFSQDSRFSRFSQDSRFSRFSRFSQDSHFSRSFQDSHLSRTSRVSLHTPIPSRTSHLELLTNNR